MIQAVDICLEVGGGRGCVLGSGLWGEVPAGGDGEGVRVHYLDTLLCQLIYTRYYDVIIMIIISINNIHEISMKS